MCYNKETSLTAFVMSYGIASYLFKRNIKYDRWFSLFLFVFSTNQLFDYLLWTDFEHTFFKSVSNLNILVSCYLLPIFLSSQFLTQLWGKYYYETKSVKKAFSMISPCNSWTSFIYWLFTIIFFLSYFLNSKSTILSKQGHLLWSSIKKNQNIWGAIIPFLFLCFIMYPYLGFVKKSLSIRTMVIFAVISLSWSFYCTDSWGSLWCWIGNFSSLIMLFSPYLDINS